MATQIYSISELESFRNAVQKDSTNLAKLRDKALASGATGTANDYQRMIDANSEKINNYNTNINNYPDYVKQETELTALDQKLEGQSTAGIPISSSTLSQSTTDNTESGGGSTTVTRAKDTPNATSQSIQSTADQLKAQSELYLQDPNTAEGKRLLEQGVTNGNITQAQFNEIKSLSQDQRFDRASDIANQGIAKESEAQAAMTRGQTTVIDQPSTTSVSSVSTSTIGSTPPPITSSNSDSVVTQPSSVSVGIVKPQTTIQSTDQSGGIDFADGGPGDASVAGFDYVSKKSSPWRQEASEQKEKLTDLESEQQAAQLSVDKSLSRLTLLEDRADQNNFTDANGNIDEAGYEQAQLALQQARAQYAQDSQYLTQVESQISETKDAIEFSTSQAELAESSDYNITTAPTPDDPAWQQLKDNAQTQQDAAMLEANEPILTNNDDPYVNYDTHEPIPIPTSNPTTFAEDDEALGGALGAGSGDVRSDLLADSGNLDEDYPDNEAFPGSPTVTDQSNKAPAVKMQKAADWRVRISLAPEATYFYKDPELSESHIMSPLKETDGVLFPYLPTVSLSYQASYDTSDITHSNYKMYSYRGSNVGDVTVAGDFTASSTSEARYVFAVIHFFRSATKMFYGKDKEAGTPPPLVYLHGYGTNQFDNHPMVISNFQYSLPNDVDYIMIGDINETLSATSSQQQSNKQTNPFVSAFNASSNRLNGSNLIPSAKRALPTFRTNINEKNGTRVPTKISLTVTCHPIVTRRNISQTFSLKDYASGKLLRGSERSGGGIW